MCPDGLRSIIILNSNEIDVCSKLEYPRPTAFNPTHSWVLDIFINSENIPFWNNKFYYLCRNKLDERSYNKKFRCNIYSNRIS